MVFGDFSRNALKLVLLFTEYSLSRALHDSLRERAHCQDPKVATAVWKLLQNWCGTAQCAVAQSRDSAVCFHAGNLSSRVLEVMSGPWGLCPVSHEVTAALT